MLTSENLLKPEAAGTFGVNGDPQSLVDACEAAGLRVYFLRLDSVVSRKELLKACYKAFKFPEHFGRNWDALRDCLLDLDEADGYAVSVVEADDLDTDVLERFVEVMREVSELWRDEGKAFWVFYETRVGLQFDLPWMVA